MKKSAKKAPKKVALILAVAKKGVKGPVRGKKPARGGGAPWVRDTDHDGS